MKQPNIIMLMSDQYRADALGCLNPHVITPNLDRLAERGILYDQAVCNCAICIPSRYSMMLGLYPSQTGVRNNGQMIPTDAGLPLPPLAQRMHMAGYQTLGFGKTHWWVGKAEPTAAGVKVEPSNRGFEVRAKTRSLDSGLWEPGAIMMEEENPEAWAQYSEEIADWGAGEENYKGYIGCTSQVPSEHHREGWLTGQCLNFLDQGGLDPDRPFFLYLSFDAPHAGYNIPKGYEDLYDIDRIPDIPLPLWENEPPGHARPEGVDPCLDVTRCQHEERVELWRRMTPQERRRTTLRYWAYCSYVDDLYGHVLRRLDELGELENSFIIYTSDHGDMLGQRFHRFSKICLYEGCVRVPIIIAGVGVPEERRGTIDHRLAELVDIVPTLMCMVGGRPDSRWVGLDLLRPEARIGQFCEHHGSGFETEPIAPAYMWRNHEWKLILYMAGALNGAPGRLNDLRGEFYHLQSDPHEWNDRFKDPECAEIRERMTRELLMHMACAWGRFPRHV